MKIKIILPFLLLAVMVGQNKVLAQATPDPAVNAATVSIAPTAVGETTNSLFFQVFNTSPSGTLGLFPPTTLSVQLSDMNVTGTFNPANVTGTIASSFTWTYNPTANMITGTLISPMAPLTGGNIAIAGIIVNDSSSIVLPQAGFNVNVNASGSNNSSLSNDFTSTFTYTQGFPLPLTVGEIRVVDINCKAVIELVTLSESNTDRAIVERSVEGNNSFEVVGAFALKGNSNTKQYYTFIDGFDFDENVKYLYRLKLKDIDDKHTYTETRIFKTNCSKSGGIAVYPNPVKSKSSFTVLFSDLADDLTEIDFALYNYVGQKIYEETETFVSQSSTNSFAKKITLGDIAKGIYTLSIVTKSESNEMGNTENIKLLVD